MLGSYVHAADQIDGDISSMVKLSGEQRRLPDRRRLYDPGGSVQQSGRHHTGGTPGTYRGGVPAQHGHSPDTVLWSTVKQGSGVPPGRLRRLRGRHGRQPAGRRQPVHQFPGQHRGSGDLSGPLPDGRRHRQRRNLADRHRAGVIRRETR